jgi:hypothetical protein
VPGAQRAAEDTLRVQAMALPPADGALALEASPAAAARQARAAAVLPSTRP